MIKPFRHCEISGTKKLKRKTSFLIEAAIYRCFSKNLFRNTELFLIKLQVFFYRAPMVAASGFLRQQIPFSAKSSMYWRQSHRFLSRTRLKTGAEPQKQPLQLSYNKRCSQKFCKFCRKIPVLKSLFNRVAGQETQRDVFMWSLRNF